MIKTGTKVDATKLDMSTVIEGYNLHFIEFNCSKDESLVPNTVSN